MDPRLITGPMFVRHSARVRPVRLGASALFLAAIFVAVASPQQPAAAPLQGASPERAIVDPYCLGCHHHLLELT